MGHHVDTSFLNVIPDDASIWEKVNPDTRQCKVGIAPIEAEMTALLDGIEKRGSSPTLVAKLSDAVGIYR